MDQCNGLDEKQMFFPDNWLISGSELIDIQEASLDIFWIGLRRTEDGWMLASGDFLDEATIPFDFSVELTGFEDMLIFLTF